VRDADSHLQCACSPEGTHVYFGAKVHRVEPSLRGPVVPPHAAELDVDDMDWGGPETITLTDPPPGEYRYWVNNYSNNAYLSASSVVVRVVVGDAVVGEYRIPAELKSREWRPFAAIRVDDRLVATVVPFTPAQITAMIEQSAAEPPPALPAPSAPATEADPGCGGAGGMVFLIVTVALVITLGLRFARRGRS
jgi:hypothetical protein